MHAGDRTEFAPPPQPGLLRAFVLAVLAHLLLVLMLTQGLRWQRETQDAAVEAELWSSVPVEAAPKPVPAPPAPPAPPPEPPKPVVKAPPQPDPQALRDAQIALEREKARRAEEERKQAELERQREERRKAAAEAKKKHEEELAKKKLEEQKIAEAKRKEAEEKKRREQQQREEREAKLREQIRKDSMSRMQDMAGTGGPNSAGTAARSAGPSKSWAGRVIARVRPNIVYTELASGNPEAVVEVRMAPDGTIVGKRLKKSSGSKSWDDAVLRALDKTEVLPRDVDGRVHSPVTILFRPKD